MDNLYEKFCLEAPMTARFLIPQGRSLTSQLSYGFTVKNLNNAHYVALSYVWGKPTSPLEANHIQLEGLPVPIDHASLRSALTTVHAAMSQDANNGAEPPLLWVDQLCINQKSNAEKSQQVALMGDLYANAQTVYICLGSSETAGDVVSLVTEVSQRITNDKKYYGNIRKIPNPGDSEADWKWYNRFNWEALKELLRQPWFTRIWVVQEAGLAKNAVALYGGLSFDWASLMLVLAWLSEPGFRFRRYHNLGGWTTQQVWASFDRVARGEASSTRHFNFLDLIGHTAYQLLATDPRDYIFALLGHPSIQRHSTGNAPRAPLMLPDYSATKNEVFIQFALKWLGFSNRPHLFSCVNHEQHWEPESSKFELGNPDDARKLGLPSWCPRWDYLPLGGSRFVDESSYHGFRTAISAEFRFQHLPFNRLRVPGLKYDIVTEALPRVEEMPNISDMPIGDTQLSSRDMANFIKVVLICCKALDVRSEISISAGGSIEDLVCSFAITMAASPLHHDRDQHLADFVGAVYEAQKSCDSFSNPVPTQYKAALSRLAVCCQGINLKLPSRRPVKLLGDAYDSLHGRRLFICQNGNIGLGPNVLAKGDHCCVIAGGQVPYLLRPFNDTGYHLVGESYIDGIMNGEVINDQKGLNLEWSDFELL